MSSVPKGNSSESKERSLYFLGQLINLRCPECAREMFIDGNISAHHWRISVTSYHQQQILFSNTDSMWTDTLGSLSTERYVSQTNWRTSGKQCENVLRARKKSSFTLQRQQCRHVLTSQMGIAAPNLHMTTAFLRPKIAVAASVRTR